MRIKKFKNLWTMGLILTGGFLFFLYVIKMAYPTFVVGVAELPSIVKIGTYIDNHIWAYYLFTFITSFITSYFHNCACVGEKRLDIKDVGIVSLGIIFLMSIQNIAFAQFQMINDFIMILTPSILCFMKKKTEIKHFYMTVLCLGVNVFGQIISLEIRDISTMITYPNSATFTILLIDAYIWSFLLYAFSNYRKENLKNG